MSDALDPGTCPACPGGAIDELGTMGRHVYFRCRQCGWQWSIPHPEADTDMVITRKQQRCLDALLALIAQGVEYPEAEWKASEQGKAIDCSTLRDLYDEHCATKDIK